MKLTPAGAISEYPDNAAMPFAPPKSAFSLPVIPTTPHGIRPGATPLEIELTRAVRGQVRFGRHDRALYATDASPYQVEPIGVVIPADVADIAATLAICLKHRVPVLPRGGGTSLAGQCTAAAVVVDLSALCRRLISADAAARICEVEAGIGIDELNRQLVAAAPGLFYAPDPATVAQAAIGGTIGNNAAGSRSIKYGRTSENLAGVDVLLSNGERTWLEPGAGRRNETARRLASEVGGVCRRYADLIRTRFAKTIRRNAGYGLDMILKQIDAGVADEDLDLSGLICGSEGTLAVVVGAKLKLMPIRKAVGLAVASFATLEDAINAVNPILASSPSAVELLDDVVLRAAMGNPVCRPYVDLLPRATGGAAPAAVLYVEYQEDSAAEVEAGFARLTQIIPGVAINRYVEKAAMNEAWTLRKSGEALLHGLPGRRKPQTFVEDNAVPPENLPRFVSGFKKIVASHGTEAAYWAHASVGVLHVRPMLDLHDDEDLRHMRQIAVEVADLARECGGVMSGEHGDGRVRGPLLERFYGPELVKAFVEIKAIFDSAGILNPGNLVGAGPVESITEHLRAHSGDGHPVRRMGYQPTPSDAEHGLVAHATSDDLAIGTSPRGTGGLPVSAGEEHGRAAHATKGEEPRAAQMLAYGTGGAPVDAHADHAHPHAAHAPSHAHAIATYFDYADQDDFGHAVEQCNGAGFCRKTAGGTMCPSYRATFDERHSTRGRGNALRDAIRGGLGNGEPVWNDPETMATLDLCLACKACKTECPSNVDVARLKAEYYAQSWRARGGAPLKAKFFGHVRKLNQLGSLTPGLANAVSNWPPVRAIMNRVLGIAAKRSLPAFAPSLYRWFAQTHRGAIGRPAAPATSVAAKITPNAHGSASADSAIGSSRITGSHDHAAPLSIAVKPKVVLYADCFATYNEPHVGQAAVRVLESLGYEVEFPQIACCGRAMISTGLLGDAIASADRALAVLAPAAEDPSVRAVVVCEPSCLSAIVDDWLSLKLDTPLAIRKKLAGKSMLVEDFIERFWNDHPTPPTIAPDAPAVVLHGHCHQKALGGDETSAKLLRRLTNGKLTVLQSGCCGMAGSFGYSADKYELSMAIGELSVFPPIRAADASAVVCAPGTSCRHQIHDGTGKRALHPIELVAKVLGI